MAKKKLVVMDGNTAAAYASYAFTEVAAIFPITPSSVMAEKVDEWSAKGRTNIFGKPVEVIEMQSEAGAAGTCHGSLQAGALTTTYTASQGLLLMIPPMYKIGGEFLPGVFHISCRTVSAHALSIFGDHSDVMTCRMTGFGMLMSSSPQEAMDLGAVAHLSAIGGRYAFMHCFDGFRTSHEMQRIEALDYDDLAKLVDYDQLAAFRKNGLNPEHPSTRGTTVNPDVFFQCKEGANEKIATIPGVVQHYMDEINKLTGRDYKLFNYYGAPDAEEVIVIMCSGAETVKDTVDYLNRKGRKVGMVQVHLYRPFSIRHFVDAIPATCKKIAVLDRTKESGSVGEPLYLDVQSALQQAGRKDIVVVGGRYGLASKDTTPGQIVAVYDNLAKEEPKNSFTIGIEDDVTFTSLPYEEIALDYPGQVSCKIWGLGGDGTVGANKNAITTIGLAADKYAQAYFSYDSMKSGGLTQSHLRFGKQPIQATYLVQHAEDAQYLSISSLAKACGVAEATIFRFCRSLGFDGYNEMKIALAKANAMTVPVALKLESGVDTQILCTHAYNTAIEALNGTRNALDPDAIDQAATLLQRARQVFCFGQGGSSLLASDIWARFATISTKFHTSGDSHMQAIAASLMGPEDVVLFVSYSGATRDMMDTLHLARENGAKVILLTHYSDAPGAALADVVLLCGAKESPLDSGSMPVKLAVLFVANVLVLRYTLDNQELANLSLSRTSRALGSKLL